MGGPLGSKGTSMLLEADPQTQHLCQTLLAKVSKTLKRVQLFRINIWTSNHWEQAYIGPRKSLGSDDEHAMI